MNKDIKTSTLGLVGGLVAALGVMGIVSVVTDDPVTTLPDDFDIATYIDIEDLKGEKGDTGSRGTVGPQGKSITGTTGADGDDGIDGVSVSIEDILAALDAREAEEDGDFEFSDAAGNFSNTITLETGTYKVRMTHFGPGYFGVSIVNEAGGVKTIADANGHFSQTKTLVISQDEDFDLKVSASGDWTIKFEEQ